jgi:hypothetical protein
MALRTSPTLTTRYQGLGSQARLLGHETYYYLGYLLRRPFPLSLVINCDKLEKPLNQNVRYALACRRFATHSINIAALALSTLTIS